MFGQARAWFNVVAVPEERAADDRRARARGDRRAGRRLHVGRRRAVARLPRDRALRHVLLRRGRAVRRRALPHRGGARAPRRRGQVVGRVRRDDLGDAAARPVRRVRDARGRRPLRGHVAAEFAKIAQELRNRYDGSYERFWEDFRSGRPVFESGVDPMLANTYAEACAYSLERRTARSTCRSGSTRAARARGVGALARPRPGAPRRRARRRAAAGARDLDRRGPQRRVPPRPRRGRLPRRRARGRRRRGRRPLRAARGHAPRHELAPRPQHPVPRRATGA